MRKCTGILSCNKYVTDVERKEYKKVKDGRNETQETESLLSPPPKN